MIYALMPLHYAIYDDDMNSKLSILFNCFHNFFFPDSVAWRLNQELVVEFGVSNLLFKGNCRMQMVFGPIMSSF